MSYELHECFDKKVIYERVLYLEETDSTLKEACEIVGKEIKRTPALLWKLYLCFGGNPDKKQELNKLTVDQEDILNSICIVYNICHQAMTVSDLIKEGEMQFDVEVSSAWTKVS